LCATTCILTGMITIATSTTTALLTEWLKSRLFKSAPKSSVTIVIDGKEITVRPGGRAHERRSHLGRGRLRLSPARPEHTALRAVAGVAESSVVDRNQARRRCREAVPVASRGSAARGTARVAGAPRDARKRRAAN